MLSRVSPLATLWSVALQAPLSMGLSREEHWSGLPFLSPAWLGVSLTLLVPVLLLLNHFSRVRLCNPIDGSPPGSAIPGILQARTLEWVAVSFSRFLVFSQSCAAIPLRSSWTFLSPPKRYLVPKSRASPFLLVLPLTLATTHLLSLDLPILSYICLWICLLRMFPRNGIT